MTEAGELKSLAALGIVELSLDAHAGNTVDNGNLLALASSYTTSDGQQHAMADVWFAKQTGDGGEAHAAAGDASLPVSTHDVLVAATSDALADATGTPTHAPATQTAAAAPAEATATTAADASATLIDQHLATLATNPLLVDDKNNNILI